MRPQLPLTVKAFQILFIAVVLLLWSTTAFAYPTWYDPQEQKGVKPNVPDFYQHQSQVFNNDPLKDGGYCWATAFLNSIYYWDKKFPDLYGDLYDDPTDSTKWLEEGMISNLKNVIGAIGGVGSAAVMEKYLSDKKHGPNDKNGLFVKTFDTFSNKDYDIFNIYQREWLASEDVLVYLKPDTKTDWWWDYHVLTGVGIDIKNNVIAFADPDSTKYKNDTDPKQQWDTQWLNWNPTPPWRNYDPNDPFPFGNDWSSVGDNNYYQTAKIDAAGKIIEGPYAGAKITKIFAISPVPEPSTLLLLGSGVASLIGFGRKRLFEKP